MPRQLAGFIARFTSAANLGPNTVDRARRRNADLTYQSGATIAVALHASTMMVCKRAGDTIEIAVVLGCESGPVARIRAASPATTAERGCFRCFWCNALSTRRQIMHPRRLFRICRPSLGRLSTDNAVRRGNVDHIGMESSKRRFHLDQLVKPSAEAGWIGWSIRARRP